jgi:hypothetical protein
MYRGVLAKWDAHAFERAGFAPFVRGRYAQIAAQEASHVAFLTAALGADAVPACEYTFPFTDPVSFAAFTQAIEGVGTSAYLGAAALISDPAILTAAGVSACPACGPRARLITRAHSRFSPLRAATTRSSPPP